MRSIAILAVLTAAVPAWSQPPAPLPRAPAVSRVDPLMDEPAATIEVHVTRGGAAVAHAAVMLVGYAADGSVHAATRATGADGLVRFEGVDTTGATAYFALAQVARGRRVDRLVVWSIVPDAQHGVRVELVGGATDAAPIDDLARVDPQGAVPAGKLRVHLAGAPDPTVPVVVVDAATGATVARGTARGDHVDLAVAPGRTVYVEATSAGHSYRSLPVQPIAGRGTTASVYALPTVMATYLVDADPADAVLQVAARVTLANNSWSPLALTQDVPLPRGFSHAQIVDGSLAELTPIGLRMRRPLPPGGAQVDVGFDLPATGGKVAWALDLPFGAWKSSFSVANVPGVALTVPPGVHPQQLSLPDGDVLQVSDVTITPGHSMVMSIAVPRLPPKQAATLHACLPLRPDRTRLLGKPMPALAVRELDGTPLRVASLRGKVLAVTFMATWDMLSRDERPTLAALATAVHGAVPLLVFSDADAAQVRADIDGQAAYRVALDPPARGANIGPTTLAWGTSLLPETYLVDRTGKVRFYFANARDWSGPDALACVRALARE